jgi:quercetin dioxygenase-like cupin family protein
VNSPWETWPEELVEERGRVLWQTLAEGEGLTLGVARLPPGEELHEHRHEQSEVYLVLEGAGVVTVDGEARDVAEGAAVFIPGNALHSCRNDGDVELRFAYVLAADSFADVEYVFST